MPAPNPVKPDPAPDVLFSLEALHRAWRLVRRNGTSPGSDGMTAAQFDQNLAEEFAKLRGEILAGQYKPCPVKRFYVPKDSGKNRPLSLWALRDRVAQRVIHDYLTPILESQFLDCSFGFRPGRSIEEAVGAIVQARESNRRWVVDADIASCFDRIPINLLMAQVRTLVPSRLAVRLIQQWLHTPVAGQYGEKAGVSQGSVISPQLANLYLHRFDQMILAALPEARLVRFADSVSSAAGSDMGLKRGAAVVGKPEVAVEPRQDTHYPLPRRVCVLGGDIQREQIQRAAEQWPA